MFVVLCHTCTGVSLVGEPKVEGKLAAFASLACFANGCTRAKSRSHVQVKVGGGHTTPIVSEKAGVGHCQTSRGQNVVGQRALAILSNNALRLVQTWLPFMCFLLPWRGVCVCAMPSLLPLGHHKNADSNAQMTKDQCCQGVGGSRQMTTIDCQKQAWRLHGAFAMAKIRNQTQHNSRMHLHFQISC